MCNYARLHNSKFENNTHLKTGLSSFAFGEAMTLDSLGGSTIFKSLNIFENNKGWSSANLYDLIADTIPIHLKSSYRHAFCSWMGITTQIIKYLGHI